MVWESCFRCHSRSRKSNLSNSYNSLRANQTAIHCTTERLDYITHKVISDNNCILCLDKRKTIQLQCTQPQSPSKYREYTWAKTQWRHKSETQWHVFKCSGGEKTVQGVRTVTNNVRLSVACFNMNQICITQHTTGGSTGSVCGTTCWRSLLTVLWTLCEGVTFCHAKSLKHYKMILPGLNIWQSTFVVSRSTQSTRLHSKSWPHLLLPPRHPRHNRLLAHCQHY